MKNLFWMTQENHFRRLSGFGQTLTLIYGTWRHVGRRNSVDVNAVSIRMNLDPATPFGAVFWAIIAAFVLMGLNAFWKQVVVPCYKNINIFSVQCYPLAIRLLLKNTKGGIGTMSPPLCNSQASAICPGFACLTTAISCTIRAAFTLAS